MLTGATTDENNVNWLLARAADRDRPCSHGIEAFVVVQISLRAITKRVNHEPPVNSSKNAAASKKKQERLLRLQRGIAKSGLRSNDGKSTHYGLRRELRELAEDPNLTAVFNEVVGRLEVRLKQIKAKRESS